MTRRVQQPAQRTNRAATLAHTAALARRLLQRRHQEPVATARAVCHRAQLQLAHQRVKRHAARAPRLGH
jgi:hypothetical protein